MDEIKKKLHIYELTVPLTMNIDQRNGEKTQKYTPFLTDISNYTCTLNCFEVSSTGYISPRNKSTLTTLHSFMRKDMKKSTFLSNLNSLAWYGSYQLWLTGEEKEFAIPPFLIAHLKWSLPSPSPHPTTCSWSTCHHCPLRPGKDTQHISGASPLLPVSGRPWVKMWAHPPSPSSFTHHLCIFKWLTAEADALPLFWEFYSGGGVICGASMHYDSKQFQYLPILLEALLYINKLYSLETVYMVQILLDTIHSKFWLF